jgi:hypothetical protein
LAVLLFDSEFWIFDLFKNSEDYEEWILKKVKVEYVGSETELKYAQKRAVGR